MSRRVTRGGETPRERAIDVIAAELVDCFPASISAGEHRFVAKAALNALADHPEVLSALAGVPHPGVEALLRACDVMDEHARDIPWISTKEIRRLLGHTTTTATLDPESTVATDKRPGGHPMSTMMRCGHAAQAVDGTGAPVCAVCAGLHPGAREIADPTEVARALGGRMMRCSYRNRRDGMPCTAHTNPRPSDPAAAFFNHRPDEESDRFYCGCWGWD